MLAGLPAFALSPSDSARAVAQVYTWSLLASVPLLLGFLAAVLLARSPAGTRVLVWRSTVAGLLLVSAAQLLPVHRIAWVIPEGLAAPLVALGRVELRDGGGAPGWVASALLAFYVGGVLLALLPLVRGWGAVRREIGDARELRSAAWRRALEEARSATGVRRPVRLLVSDRHHAPATAGVLRPVILLPPAALHWPAAQRRAVLLHELAHVGRGDVLAGMLARVACALLWFHPGAWIAASRLRAECELACDDRVLAAGVKRSDYAELLVRVAGSRTLTPRMAATGIAGGGIRRRLRQVLTPGRDLRAPGGARIAVAVALTVAVSLPVGTLRLAPTRDVLTTLMHDTRWEARAWAVLGLAQRPDSLAIAQAAARLDPSPRVRALASSAVAQQRAATFHNR